MDVQSEDMEPVTPGLNYANVGDWKTEDSGYNSSYTPGTLECSEISSVNLKVGITGQFQSDVNVRPTYQSSSAIPEPQNRKGVKRAYNGEPEDVNCGSVPTPTISDKKFNGSCFSVRFDSADLFVGDLCSKNEHAPYRSTPVKKVCGSNCELNSLNSRKPGQKLDFATHSLLCDTQALQPINKKPVIPRSSASKAYKFRPNQRVDIIKLLYQDGNIMPPVMKIFSYLSNEDIFNFTLVSTLWQNVWEDVSKVRSMKREYLNYLKDEKDNQENKVPAPKSNECNHIGPLIEINNVIRKTTRTPLSPPGTPRTIKFKRFIKAASLDSRKQLPCVRCQHPAKVTEESTGEEWAECLNVNCSYQFCGVCKFDRHQGKDCSNLGFDSPSPSQRMENSCLINSKKSRKNLKRLLY